VRRGAIRAVSPDEANEIRERRSALRCASCGLRSRERLGAERHHAVCSIRRMTRRVLQGLVGTFSSPPLAAMRDRDHQPEAYPTGAFPTRSIGILFAARAAGRRLAGLAARSCTTASAGARSGPVPRSPAAAFRDRVARAARAHDGGDFSRADEFLNAIGKLQQPDRIGDMAAALADDLCDVVWLYLNSSASA